MKELTSQRPVSREASVPSPGEIRCRTREIRRRWSPAEARRRAERARHWMLLLGAALSHPGQPAAR